MYMSTRKILVISRNYVDSLVEETLCLCILNIIDNRCNNNTTSRHVVSSFYHGNSPIFSVLCYCSALFLPAAGQPTLASGWAKTRAPNLSLMKFSLYR